MNGVYDMLVVSGSSRTFLCWLLVPCSLLKRGPQLIGRNLFWVDFLDALADGGANSF